jgi:hypothetical protein
VGSTTLQVVGPRTLVVKVKKPQLPIDGVQGMTVSGPVRGEHLTVTYRARVVATAVAGGTGMDSVAFKVGRQTGTAIVTVVGAYPSRAGSARFTVRR